MSTAVPGIFISITFYSLFYLNSGVRSSMIPRLAYILTATGVPASMVISSSAIIGSSLPSKITVPIFSPALMNCGIKLVKIP